MAPTIGRVALDNGFHGSIPGDWVAPPPQNIQPVLPLYVRILQSQTHIDQDPPVGRFRILDSDETSGPEFLPLAGHTG